MKKLLSIKTLLTVIVIAIASSFDTLHAQPSDLKRFECEGFSILLPGDLKYSEEHDVFISESTNLVFNYSSAEMTDGFDPIKILAEEGSELGIQMIDNEDFAVVKAGANTWVPYNISDRALVAVIPAEPDIISYTVVCLMLPDSSVDTILRIATSIRTDDEE